MVKKKQVTEVRKAIASKLVTRRDDLQMDAQEMMATNRSA
jgi:hypothetical protein